MKVLRCLSVFFTPSAQEYLWTSSPSSWFTWWSVFVRYQGFICDADVQSGPDPLRPSSGHFTDPLTPTSGCVWHPIRAASPLTSPTRPTSQTCRRPVVSGHFLLSFSMSLYIPFPGFLSLLKCLTIFIVFFLRIRFYLSKYLFIICCK